MRTLEYDMFCGLDVGKVGRHACATNRDGTNVHDKPLPQHETRLREMFERLAQHGRVLVVVDPLASIGALSVAVACDASLEATYLSGLAIRRMADLHPGNTKANGPGAFQDRRRVHHEGDLAVLAQFCEVRPR